MSRRQRTLLIILGLVAVGAAGIFLMTRSGGDEEQAAPTTATSPPVSSIDANGGKTLAQPPKVFRFFGGRDPFVPLVVAEAGAAGGEPAEAQAAEAPAEQPIEPAPAGAEQAAEAETVTVDQKMVTLVDVVDEHTAQVAVDERTHTVREGKAFARYFQVASVSANCARMLFGDESFTLCRGGALT